MKNICELKKFQQKLAFTLAEVLITLGIIGVVAALTLPILMANHQKSQTLSQLKATFTILNQAFNMAKVNYGLDANTWYIPNTQPQANAYFAENYLLPYLKTSNICAASTSGECKHNVDFMDKSDVYPISGDSDLYSITLMNGAVVGVSLFNITGTTLNNCRAQLYLDVNGVQPPNIMGKDSFIIELGDSSGDKNKFYPYSPSTPRTTILNPGTTNCNKTTGSGARCFALIMQDGWQIKDDYPWD